MVKTNFTGLKKDHDKYALMYDFGMLNPRPILADQHGESGYLIDGGDGKYHFWNNMSDAVFLINQPDLEQILVDPDLYFSGSAKVFTYLGDAGYDAYADDPEFLEEELSK